MEFVLEDVEQIPQNSEPANPQVEAEIRRLGREFNFPVPDVLLNRRARALFKHFDTLANREASPPEEMQPEDVQFYNENRKRGRAEREDIDAVDLTQRNVRAAVPLGAPPPIPPRPAALARLAAARAAEGKPRRRRLAVTGRRSRAPSTRGLPLALSGNNSVALEIAKRLAAGAEQLAHDRINTGSGMKMSDYVYAKGNGQAFGIGKFKSSLSRNLRMNYKAKMIEARAARMIYNKVKNQLYGRAIHAGIQTKLANGTIENAHRHKARGRKGPASEQRLS